MHLNLTDANFTPELAVTKRNSGNLPLHTAAAKPISRQYIMNLVQIIKLLIHSYPEAYKTNNIQGKYPLNLAIKSGKKWKNAVKVILNAFTEAIDSLNLDSRFYTFLFTRASTGAGAGVSYMYKLVTVFHNIQPS